MLGKKAAAVTGIAVVALVLGVGAAAASDDGKEQNGTRVTSEQPEATRPPTLVAPAGKDQ
jgi:hypothetical protein